VLQPFASALSPAAGKFVKRQAAADGAAAAVSSGRTPDTVFALVLGMLAFLYVTATAVLLGVEINVVRVNRLHLRSLLTPFTDNVTLTTGDRRAYSRQAKAQRSKGFQRVDVNFDPPSAEPATTIPARKQTRRVPPGKLPPERAVLARLRRSCWRQVAAHRRFSRHGARFGTGA
jgi:hypothetical protein